MALKSRGVPPCIIGLKITISNARKKCVDNCKLTKLRCISFQNAHAQVKKLGPQWDGWVLSLWFLLTPLL